MIALTSITAETVFGGVVLLALLGLIITGKLRLEREIHNREAIIEKKNETIDEQWRTIQTLTGNHEITHDLLQSIRSLAEGRSPGDTNEERPT